MDDAWERNFFGQDGCEPFDDSDNDGHSNYFEFLTGSDPLLGTSFFRQTVARNGSLFTLRWSSVPGRLYTIQFADQPNGTWNDFSTITGAAFPATETEDIIYTAGERKFFRIVIHRVFN
jgi:hypothetical protein